MGAAFFARVDNGFAAIASADPERVVVIDASAAPEEVVSAIRQSLKTRTGR